MYLLNRYYLFKLLQASIIMTHEREGEFSSHGFSSGENVHIGDQGEYYCRSLYKLMKHPNGDRRPDLISVNGSYSPKLSMEVKTSLTGKGIINPYGLTYGFSGNFDYNEVFNADLPAEQPQQLIADIEFRRFRSIPEVAFYYNLMQRTDQLSGEDFKNKFSDLGITFGHQMLIPHELIFYLYVIGKMRGNGRNFEKAFDSVRQIVIDFSTKGYDYASPGKNDCQAIHFNDLLSLYLDDRSLLISDEAKDRVDLLLKHYGEDRLAELQKIEYAGPNNTRICAFYKPEHENIFVEQIRQRIGERRDIVKRLSNQRLKEAASLKKGYGFEGDMFPPQEGRLLSQKDRINLERLLEWRRIDDIGPEFSDIHPSSVERNPTQSIF